MADKVSLEKNINPTEIQNINRKLDFLIDEVQNIRREMQDLETQNSDKLYQLDSRFYKLCSDLQHQIYEFQNKFYSGTKNVTQELKELQSQTGYSHFLKNISLTSAVMMGGLAWLLSMILILD